MSCNLELVKQAKIQGLRSLYKTVSEGSITRNPREDWGRQVSDRVSAYFEWEKTRTGSATVVGKKDSELLDPKLLALLWTLEKTV
jgi:hypothetical protein